MEAERNTLADYHVRQAAPVEIPTLKIHQEGQGDYYRMQVIKVQSGKVSNRSLHNFLYKIPQHKMKTWPRYSVSTYGEILPILMGKSLAHVSLVSSRNLGEL